MFNLSDISVSVGGDNSQVRRAIQGAELVSGEVQVSVSPCTVV